MYVSEDDDIMSSLGNASINGWGWYESRYVKIFSLSISYTLI